jgi:DNA modification methylase
MMGIPWRVAFALQADGWYLRQDIIWHKPNAMPESVRDRCVKAHEYMFLLSKSEHYFFDYSAIKESAVGGSSAAAASFKRRAGNKRNQVIPGHTVGTHRPERDDIPYNGATRNKRSVWNVATKACKNAHFATFPPALIEPCVLAGCPAGGVVLDPFAGSGTTGMVATQHGRGFIGIELNPEYVELARIRVSSVMVGV